MSSLFFAGLFAFVFSYSYRLVRLRRHCSKTRECNFCVMREKTWSFFRRSGFITTNNMASLQDSLSTCKEILERQGPASANQVRCDLSI